MTRAGVSIGQVLDELRPEFPDISPSKIRFLEAEGLIQPLRSSSGYRRFAVADIERLRFILTAQRDEYLPLRVIKDRLDAVDGTAAGGAGEVPPVAMTRSELLTAAGAAEGLLAELEDYGLVRRARVYGTQALSVVREAVLLAEYGIQPRHLRAVKASADREASLVEQAVAPMTRQKGSREPALRAARDIAGRIARLHATLVEDGLTEAGLASQSPVAGTPPAEPRDAPGLRSASGR
jgi:DNA-binding transcriptional MerR regulator